MATPTLSAGLTEIDDADVITGWVCASGISIDADFKLEGTGSTTTTLRADLTVAYYDIVTDGGSAIDLTGQHVRAWINFTGVGFLDTEANNGMEFYMYDGTNTAYWVAFGSDTYTGGWKNVIVDADSTPDSGSYNKASVRRWGFRFNRDSAPPNKDNVWFDYYRYGDGYYATGGTSGDEITLAGIYTQDIASAHGIVDRVEGVYFCYGSLQIGNGVTTTWFEMDKEVLVYTDSLVASGLYDFIGDGSGCRVTITDSVLRAAGTGDNTRFAIDFSTDAPTSVTFTDNNILRAADISFASGQTATNNIFDDCRQITHGGADMDNCSISNYEGTANTSALIYNVNADPDGEIDGMTFEKGTAATHAIEFGLSSPLSMTLRDVTCTGYNALDTQNDSTFHFKRTSGTVTLTLDNFTGNFTYRTDGATIDIVTGAVTVQATAALKDGTPVENARVFLKASDGTGPFPFEDTVTITRSTTTATVSHTAHGMATNDKIYLDGITDKTEDNWRVIDITVTGVNSYTFTTTDSGSTSYTGTIKCTFVALNGLTNVSGILSTSRVYASNQPVTGWTRKSTSSPLLQEGVLVGTVNSSTGFAGTAVMLADE